MRCEITGLEYSRYEIIPSYVYTDDRFRGLSMNAIISFVAFLDRAKLSLKNAWHDENGESYIIYSLANLCERLHCSRPTAIKVMKELKEQGIIKCVQNTSRIYLQKLERSEAEIAGGKNSLPSVEVTYNTYKTVDNSVDKTEKLPHLVKNISEEVKILSQEVKNLYSSNTTSKPREIKQLNNNNNNAYAAACHTERFLQSFQAIQKLYKAHMKTKLEYPLDVNFKVLCCEYSHQDIAEAIKSTNPFFPYAQLEHSIRQQAKQLPPEDVKARKAMICRWEEEKKSVAAEQNVQETKCTDEYTVPLSVSKLVSKFEENICRLQPAIKEKFLSMCSRYSSKWINEAITEAVEHNVLKFKYVAGILSNWERYGFQARPAMGGVR